MIKEIFHIMQTTAYGILILLGDYMQAVAKHNPSSYNWFTGHLSDIGIPASSTAVGLMLSDGFFKNNKYLNIASLIIPPTICTIDELKVFDIAKNKTTYDPQDIACFFAGSLIAYGLSKANENGVFGKTFKKIKNKFNKKSLENIVVD